MTHEFDQVRLHEIKKKHFNFHIVRDSQQERVAFHQRDNYLTG